MFLHHRRRGKRTLGVAHSSGHEGTNFGIKAHSAGIKATMGMDKSAEALSLQSSIKTAELDEMAWHDYIARNKRWSNLPSSPDTCRHAEGLLTVVMLRRDLYVARRVGEREFEVEYIGDAVFFKDYLDCGIFPLFWRCRRDTVTDDGKLVCSCKAFEEDGIPCEHIACVVEAVMKACEGEEWKGFTVNDISVRWWSSYMYLAYRETTDDDTNAMFHWLATNDITGPSLPCAISASMPNLVGLPPPPFIC